MSTGDKWRERLAELPATQREKLSGGTLSQRFSRLPLWANHPAYVGGFYGLLVAIALIFPIGYKTDWEANSWWMTWIFTALLLVFTTSLLGLVSRCMSGIFRRPPIEVPRKVVFITPFVGVFWMTLELTDLLTLSSSGPWILLLFPGPLYVHLTWAPRWRLISLFEAGGNPFADYETDKYQGEDVFDGDQDVLGAVDLVSNDDNSANSEEE